MRTAFRILVSLAIAFVLAWMAWRARQSELARELLSAPPDLPPSKLRPGSAPSFTPRKPAPPPPTPPEPPKELVSVRGTVLGADGVPLEGAEVWPVGAEIVSTDSKGAFEIRVPRGRVVMAVVHDDHLKRDLEVDAPAEGVVIRLAK